ncbi:MAG: hypothetical protein M1825_005430 [Sarcosagium campestre]|nr:MAG: hypothetical protein M1825_005430 [Sarcosagium campestre]
MRYSIPTVLVLALAPLSLAQVSADLSDLGSSLDALESDPAFQDGLASLSALASDPAFLSQASALASDPAFLSQASALASDPAILSQASAFASDIESGFATGFASGLSGLTSAVASLSDALPTATGGARPNFTNLSGGDSTDPASSSQPRQTGQARSGGPDPGDAGSMIGADLKLAGLAAIAIAGLVAWL